MDPLSKTKQAEKTGGSGSLTDFLTAPRKRRKNYVIVAAPANFDTDLLGGIEGYVKRSFPGLAISKPRSLEELVRQMGRNIALLILCDGFDNAEEQRLLDVIRVMKEKRREEAIPVLFLTRNAARLVRAYHETLLPYHETDEYLELSGITRPQLFGRIKEGIENKNRRRGRRYKVSLPASFYLLSKDKTFHAELQDLSIYGALLHSEGEQLLRAGDQLKLHIPISGVLPPHEGEFLRLSGKVRRVFISGNLAGVSFEHVSDQQLKKLTLLLTKLVMRDLGKKAQKYQSAISALQKKEGG